MRRPPVLMSGIGRTCCSTRRRSSRGTRTSLTSLTSRSSLSSRMIPIGWGNRRHTQRRVEN